MATSPRSAMGVWISTRFDAYGRTCLVVCLLVTPLIFYHRRSNVFWLSPKMAVLWVTVLGALAFWAFWCAERRRFLPRSRLLWVTAAYVCAVSIATVFSLSPRLSVVGLPYRFGGLLPRLVYMGAMVAVVGLYSERPERLRLLQLAIAASAVVEALVVLLQESGVDRTLWAGPVLGTLYDYPPGLQGFSNFAGAHLGMAVPCLWYLTRTCRSPRWRALAGAGLGIDLAGLWFTRSRGGMLAAVVGLAVFALANRARPLRRWGRGGLVAVAVLAVLAGVYLGSGANDVKPPPGPVAGTDVLRSKTLAFRLTYWRAAVRIFADHPIVGTGPDTFYAFYPPYRPASDGSSLNARIELDKPHNVFLEHATNSGALGLASYLLVLGLALHYGFRRRLAVEGHERALLSAFLGLLCAYLAQAVVSIDEPIIALTGWVAIGGCAVLADPSLLRARSDPGPGRTGRDGHAARKSQLIVRRAVLVMAAPVAVAMSAIGLAPLRAELAIQDGRFEDALRLNPTDFRPHMTLASRAHLAGGASPDAEQKRRLLIAARRDYLAALALKPRDRTTLIGLASVETSWASSLDPAHFADAERWWRQVLAFDPHNQFLRQSYDQDFPEAVRRTVIRLEAEAQVQPQDAAVRVDLAYAYLAEGKISKARVAAEGALAIDPSSTRARAFLAGHPPR